LVLRTENKHFEQTFSQKIILFSPDKCLLFRVHNIMDVTLNFALATK
jgi:hypothetical protein